MDTATDMDTTRIMPLELAVGRHVQPGDHLHFAATPSRSNAAIRELARGWRGEDPEFTLSMTGFHSTAHLLGLLRLGRRYLGCFFGDVYPAPRPNRLYSDLQREGAVFEHWSLLTMLAALRAGAQGHPYVVARCSAASDLAAELSDAGRIQRIPAVEDEDLVLVSALRPDVTFVHAALGDRTGRVAMFAPYGEGPWGALAAKRGVIATVEEVVDPGRLDTIRGATLLPAHRVLAVCPAPWGAHPQPFYAPGAADAHRYRDDYGHYLWWRAAATEPAELDGFAELVLQAADGAAGYLEFAGRDRLHALATDLRGDRTPPAPADLPAPATDEEIMVIRAARVIASRVRARGYRVILAGIGQSFEAARLARARLRDQGVEVHVMVEIGLYDVDHEPGGDAFLLGYDTIANAGRHTGIEDVLGTLACGADNRCLAVIGAAQIDATGAVNSTRLGDGTLLVGSGGAHDLAVAADEVLVLVPCERRRMVAKVDYVTSPGRAVRHVVTDRATFRRSGPDADADRWLIDDWCAQDPGTPGDPVAAFEGCGWEPRPVELAQPMPPVTGTELSTLRDLRRRQVSRPPSTNRQVRI